MKVIITFVMNSFIIFSIFQCYILRYVCIVFHLLTFTLLRQHYTNLEEY